MKKYCLVIFLTLFSILPASASAASPPSLAVPAGLSIAELKITGNEFVLLLNNTGATITDLSKYWLYDFNNTNPLASGVSSSIQQLPAASLASGQTILLSANGGSTCGAAVTTKLSISLTDGGGFLEVVQTSLNSSGALVQSTGDAVNWSSGANSTAGMITNVPSSSSAPNGAYYRYQNTISGPAYLWQLANQDTTNLCQLNVTIGGVTTAGPVNPGNQLLPGSPPAAIFVTDDSLVQANILPPSDVGLAAPVINELLPNPADPKPTPKTNLSNSITQMNKPSISAASSCRLELQPYITTYFRSLHQSRDEASRPITQLILISASQIPAARCDCSIRAAISWVKPTPTQQLMTARLGRWPAVSGIGQLNRRQDR